MFCTSFGPRVPLRSDPRHYQFHDKEFIFIPRQTVSLYHNFSVWLDTLNASSWDRNPTKFTLN